MNNEVKEILEEFLKEKGAYSLRYSFNGDLAYSQEQMLKDYITNLQEENERLNTELKAYKDEFCKDTIKEYELVMEQEDYKSRCEKAIEFIEKNRVKATPFFKQFDGDLIMPKREVDKLLIILNGGDE